MSFEIIRPFGVVLDGELRHGWELVRDGGRIVEIRPHTGMPEAYLVSPAFVNAHSHLEYRGMLGRIPGGSYVDFIRAITALKQQESAEEVSEACPLAARENRATGVAVIGEHTDRVGSALAMKEAGLKGALFQETITFFEWQNPSEKLAAIRAKAALNGAHLSPHAYQTLDAETLRMFGASDKPISIHVAETPAENALTLSDSGPLAEFRRTHGLPSGSTGKRLISTLDEVGLCRPSAQFVHCCDVNGEDIRLMATRGVTVAHCPRSNRTLGCPDAPVREMLDAGLTVGLGLDSVASSGEINVFGEMRAALETSYRRGKPLTAEEVWSMATTMGYASIPGLAPDPWRIEVGRETPLIAIAASDLYTLEGAIESASPEHVTWLG